MKSPLDRVFEALDRVDRCYRRSGTNWQAQCPAHDDHAPSLSIREGSDGRVLLHCFAGCKTAAILEALGLQFADLFPRQPGGRKRGGLSLP